MNKKVYCEWCKNRKDIHCKADYELKETYLSPQEMFRKLIKDKNKHNDCKDFKAEEPPVTWRSGHLS